MRWLLLLLVVAGCKKDARDERMDHDKYHYLMKPTATALPELYSRAVELARKNDYAGAKQLYQQAAEREPENPMGWIGLASCDVQTHEYDLARQHYHKAGKSTSAEVGLGSVDMLESKWADAATHYELAVALEESNADAHWGAAMAYDRLGNREKARVHAKRFVELAPSSQFAGRATQIILK